MDVYCEKMQAMIQIKSGTVTWELINKAFGPHFDTIFRHPAFNDTLYQNRKNLLLKYADFSIPRQSYCIRSGNNIGFTTFMSFPILKKSNTLPLYRIYQTGMS